MADGERGVDMVDDCGWGTLVVEKEMDRSGVGVESSMTGGVV
jgi:hypothetical protein